MGLGTAKRASLNAPQAQTLESTMSLPSRGEIRTQLLIVVGFATVALSATTFFMEGPSPRALAAQAALSAQSVVSDSSHVDWEDVNLMNAALETPEATVKTARSKMLSDFEAR